MTLATATRIPASAKLLLKPRCFDLIKAMTQMSRPMILKGPIRLSAKPTTPRVKWGSLGVTRCLTAAVRLE